MPTEFEETKIRHAFIDMLTLTSDYAFALDRREFVRAAKDAEEISRLATEIANTLRVFYT